ncbi:MAG: DUF1207 domain-containing protein [Chlamydiales bacterium]|nr:DUF1207 domain-containing protein [Chlamydiales bacterium]
MADANSFEEVEFENSYTSNQEIESTSDLEWETCDDEDSILLPELHPFFPTMLAQPHIVGYSAGYRTYDKIFKTSVLPVSIGDQFSLYHYKLNCGQLYWGIEACVWAVFEARTKSLSLINADYYIAFPFTYINDNFAMRLRLFHESSHLGDEFLIERRNIKRLNPSMEVIDLSLAYDITDQLTTFVGYSRVLRSDESYVIRPNSVYYGFNYHLNCWRIRIGNLDALPYFATYFTNMEDHKWALDSSVAVGYQWEKSCGHKLRVFIEGYDGYSAEGQFSKQKTSYAAVKMFYGY